MKPQPPQPPRWATRFLRWYCRPRLLEDLEGDLNEYFDRNVKSRGPRRARLIYILDVLKFLRLYTIQIPSLSNSPTSWIMIGSYIKTTRRNMARNKLFSFINIFGLSISMSVGLLVISFVSDLWSYDDFHDNRDRIYRINTEDHRPAETMVLASTSVPASKAVGTSVAGVESLTLFRAFGKEAVVGDALLPLNGLWADQNFLQIFSFNMLEGDRLTALNASHSIVLTQKSATKLFGTTPALGKIIQLDSVDYTVSGVLQDLPKLSHLRFDALISFATIEQHTTADQWEDIYTNHVYVLLADGVQAATVQRALDQLCAAHGALPGDRRISLQLQSLNGITTGPLLQNVPGPSMPTSVLWVLSGLAFVVILSACFNYTNLSVARALRRSREIGIRKIVGAYKRQVVMQFMVEAIVIALFALVFSFIMFFFLRRQFLLLHFALADMVSLELSPRVVLYFLGLALATGLLGGVVPALLFARIKVVQALKDTSSIRLFRAVNMRKSLIVVQYVFSLIFITTAIVGYHQHKSFLAFDLGFKTENILNIKLRGANSKLLMDELLKSPMVTDVSRCQIVTSVGNMQSTSAGTGDLSNSGSVLQNIVDERYVVLHGHALLAGRNFNWKADSVAENEVLINEQVLKQFDIAKGNPHEALGEVLIMDDQKLTIVGILKDFHYSTLLHPIGPTVLRYQPNAQYDYVNVKLQTDDLPSAMAWVEAAWRKLDARHPLQARFYDDQIEEAYAMFSVMIRTIGFLAFLAVCIASVGMLGMIVFTTETKVKEISIRKVLGASEGSLIILLGRGFLILLVVAAGIALPATYFFFNQVVLPLFTYHDPIHWLDMITGLAGILVLAGIMIGSQTLKVARTNPATTLKAE
jgi:putative ABC transport system permease protein